MTARILFLALLATTTFASATASAKPVIIDQIITNGPGTNRPFGLFEGKAWRAVVDYEIVRFDFNAPIPIAYVELEYCAPPENDPEFVMQARDKDEGWIELDEDWKVSPTGRVTEWEPEDDVKAWSLEIHTEAVGDCIQKLTILDSDKKPVPTNVVRTVATTAECPRTYPGYPIEFMFDGNFSTAWSTKGDGKGAELTYTFAEPQWITDIYVWHGYRRSPALFKDNASPTKVTVVIDQEPPQSFSIPKEEHPSKEPELNLAKRVQAQKVVLRIDDIRPGKKYKDTLISELRFADGDSPFIPDPTPTYEANAAALRKQLSSAGLDKMVDVLNTSKDDMWQVGFFADGRVFFKHYVNSGEGDYFSGELSYEVKEVKGKQANLRVYGSVTKIPVTKGKQGNKQTKTLSTRVLVEPSGEGVKLKVLGKHAKFLTIPDEELSPSGPWRMSKREKTRAEAGFQVLDGLYWKPPGGGDFRIYYRTTRSIKLQGKHTDGKTYDTTINLKETSLEKGRMVHDIEGFVVTTKNGKPDGRTKTSGTLTVIKDGAGYRFEQEGDWAKLVALPKGTWTLDW